MPSILFVEPDGNEVTVDVPEGSTLMEAATGQDVDGILAICGGGCSCSTCHVYLDKRWIDRVDAPGSDEKDILETAWEPRPNSRLSCQVTVTDDMDGMVVRVPESQNG